MSGGNGEVLGPLSQLFADHRNGVPEEVAHARYEAGVAAMNKAWADSERRWVRAIIDERLAELGLLPAQDGGSTYVG